MKLARDRSLLDLEEEIKRRFSEFNASRPPSPRRRRFPRDMKDMVCRAAAQGSRLAALREWTDTSRKVIDRWIAKGKAKRVAPRRLEVVRAGRLPPSAVAVPSTVPLLPPSAPSGAFVRLPSGITIELVDSRALTPSLIAALCHEEVPHVASR